MRWTVPSRGVESGWTGGGQGDGLGCVVATISDARGSLRRCNGRLLCPHLPLPRTTRPVPALSSVTSHPPTLPSDLPPYTTTPPTHSSHATSASITSHPPLVHRSSSTLLSTLFSSRHGSPSSFLFLSSLLLPTDHSLHLPPSLTEELVQGSLSPHSLPRGSSHLVRPSRLPCPLFPLPPHPLPRSPACRAHPPQHFFHPSYPICPRLLLFLLLLLLSSPRQCAHILSLSPHRAGQAVHLSLPYEASLYPGRHQLLPNFPLRSFLPPRPLLSRPVLLLLAQLHALSGVPPRPVVVSPGLAGVGRWMGGRGR